MYQTFVSIFKKQISHLHKTFKKQISIFKPPYSSSIVSPTISTKPELHRLHHL
ncbi:hypothetical protein HanIR_Chr02g0065571 [Helianthus annuus]|nr:hypothetical protein HanIR_Chr02g0065571 [Helianthus annuus]